MIHIYRVLKVPNSEYNVTEGVSLILLDYIYVKYEDGTYDELPFPVYDIPLLDAELSDDKQTRNIQKYIGALNRCWINIMQIHLKKMGYPTDDFKSYAGIIVVAIKAFNKAPEEVKQQIVKDSRRLLREKLLIAHDLELEKD